MTNFDTELEHLCELDDDSSLLKIREAFQQLVKSNRVKAAVYNSLGDLAREVTTEILTNIVTLLSGMYIIGRKKAIEDWEKERG